MADYDSLTQVELSRALGVSLTSVQNYIRQGCPSTKKGKVLRFCLSDVVRWRDKQGRSKVGRLEIERSRLAKEQADKCALENAQKRGELVPVADVVKVWERRIGGCRSRLLGLPGRIAPQVVGCSSIAEVRDLIERHIHECLDELASGRSILDGDEGVEESAASAVVGVGGQAAQAFS